MTLYLLDTSVIIDYVRAKPQTVRLINDLHGSLASSYLCLAELYEGVYRVRDQKVEEHIFREFFSNLSQVFGLDAETAQIFGQLRAFLKARGKVIEDMDLMIAATCLRHNCTFVTENKKHFDRIPNLQIL